jgi:hypothetical protein
MWPELIIPRLVLSIAGSPLAFPAGHLTAGRSDHIQEALDYGLLDFELDFRFLDLTLQTRHPLGILHRVIELILLLKFVFVQRSISGLLDSQLSPKRSKAIPSAGDNIDSMGVPDCKPAMNCADSPGWSNCEIQWNLFIFGV